MTIQGARPSREPFWDCKASHWIEVLLTVTLIIVGVLQYTVYNRQAGIMDKQADIAGRQLSDAENAATESAAQTQAAIEAAVKGAEAASKQAATAEDTERRQLRAYVMVEVSKSALSDTGTPTIHLNIRNFGSTPAYNLRHWACYDISSVPDQDADFFAPDLITKSTEAPGSLIPPHGTIGKEYSGVTCKNTQLSTEELNEIKAGTKAIYAIGVMKYRDTFGVERVTEYRRGWNPVRGGIDGYHGNCVDEDCPKN